MSDTGVGFFAPLTQLELQAISLSLRVALASVLIGLPLAVLAALALSRLRFFGRPVLDAVVHLPVVLPPVVIGYLLLLFFGIKGPIGNLLNEWFSIRFVFTTKAVVLATVVMTFPLLVRSARIAVEAIDPRLEEAARTLGARGTDRFFSIILPLMAPGVLAGAVTAFAAGLGEFGAVITFAANIPGETQTLPLAIYTAMQSPGGDVAAARLSCVSIGLAILGLALAEVLGRCARNRIQQ
jgi:molybdate transport system permease protein